MAKGSMGMVMRITGPVVDIKFEPNELPEIFHAVTIEHNGEKYRDTSFTSLNGNIVVTSADDISVQGSNNSKTIKETDWFKEYRNMPLNWQ